MEERSAERLDRTVGVIGLGCWQLGADWGEVDEGDALAVLHAAVDSGVTFLDTADVYGDGRSEALIGRFLRDRGRGGLTVATKMGRRVDQVPENYTRENFLAWTDRSRANLGVDTLDLVQLHCPPTPVYSRDEVYDALDEMVEQRRIAAYGVSVETVDDALTAIARRGVASVQIILNIFRQRPLERVLPAAADAGVAIIARVPLASRAAQRPLRPLTQRSHPTTTATTTATVRPSTWARPSPACHTRSGCSAVDRLRPLAPERRDHGAVRAALDRRPAAGERGHPRGAQPGAGARQRCSRRARTAAASGCMPRPRRCTTS